MEFPILICDDSQLAQRMLRKTLPHDWPVDVHLAEHGQQALTVLQQTHISVCFIDLAMPQMDGWELLQAIKQQGIETLSIVVTGDRQRETRSRALQYGAVEVLTKPVCPQALGRVLQDFGLYSPSASVVNSTI